MNEEDYEMGAELGEPSADCKFLSIAEIDSEVVDMKTMIARLLKNGGDEE